MSTLEVILIVFAVVFSGFFAGMESGMLAVNRLRLRHLVRHRVKGAASLQGFLSNADRLLGTTLVGNHLANTTFTILLVSVGARLLGDAGAWIAALAAAGIVLAGCEYLPKLWFQAFPSRRCLPFAPLLEGCARVLYPVSRALTRVVHAVTPFLKTSEARRQPATTREEILRLVQEGQRSGVLSQEEVRMIGGVFDLRTLTCKDIMMPRSRMVYVQHTTSREDILMLARAQKADQFPVFDSRRDNFIGVCYLVDVLADEAPEGKTARDYMRPPQLVGADTPVDHVMPRMRVTRQPMVLVANNRRGVIGYITLDDVVEEIVG